MKFFWTLDGAYSRSGRDHGGDGSMMADVTGIQNISNNVLSSGV